MKDAIKICFILHGAGRSRPPWRRRVTVGGAVGANQILRKEPRAQGGAEPQGKHGASSFPGIARDPPGNICCPCFSFIPRTDCTTRVVTSLTARRCELVARPCDRVLWGQERSGEAGAPAPRRASRLSQPKVLGTLGTSTGDSSRPVNKPGKIATPVFLPARTRSPGKRLGSGLRALWPEAPRPTGTHPGLPSAGGASGKPVQTRPSPLEPGRPPFCPVRGNPRQTGRSARRQRLNTQTDLKELESLVVFPNDTVQQDSVAPAPCQGLPRMPGPGHREER